MTSVGERLKAEREAKQLSTSQVAEATRMKIQTIEQIERNEFDRIAAPIYARGFIRMYAEFLGLDPAPLVLEYAQRTAGARPPGPVAAPGAVTARAPSRAAKTKAVPAARPAPRLYRPDWPAISQTWVSTVIRTFGCVGDWLRRLSFPSVFVSRRFDGIVRPWRPSYGRQTLRYAGVVAGALVVVVLLSTMVTRCGRLRKPAAPVQTAQPRNALKLTREPPPPYLDFKPRR
jgi:transcriptional regulator with XRE-family HTH domain